MNPIEKVHRMIAGGMVLGPNGGWLPHTEALKIKREMTGHVVNGEVEINGKWIKLDEIDAESDSIPESLTPPVDFKLDDVTETERLDLSAQPIIDEPTKEHKPAQAPQTATVTIRTIPIGKETSLTISESRIGGLLVAICSIRGFIDQSNADEFNHQLISMLEFGVRFFIVDFEQTTLVGSAAWGVIAAAARLIKSSNGLLLICSMKEEIEEAFHLLQFDNVIEAHKTMDDCFKVIQSRTGGSFSKTTDDGEKAGLFQDYDETYEELPLDEKIRTIIARNGPVSLFKIASYLRQDQYGRVKINPLKLYFRLKEINLETRWKRVRYYRSC